MRNYDLIVVMPVYNEAEAIAPVLKKWMAMLDTLNIRYRIQAYNDGSKDATGEILRRVAEASSGRVLAINKPNSGHGPTIRQGYLEAAQEADWVFQIDSDDEMGPEAFPALWAQRDGFDFLVGRRDGRKQPLPRKVISFVSRLCVRLFYGKGVWDVNAPYRLMRAETFAPFYAQIPSGTFAPNVILSGLAAHHCLRLREIPVPQHDRTTGEVSIKKWKLLKAAASSFWQTIAFAVRQGTCGRLFVGILIGAFVMRMALVGIRGANYDTLSFRIVAEQMRDGLAPWLCGRYNYGFPWAWVVSGIYSLLGSAWLDWGVVALLAFSDVVIAGVLWRKGFRWGAILFALSPLGIWSSGCFRMFDNVAILVALLAMVALEKETSWRRTIGSALLLGCSITLKHVCFFFPIWLAFRERRWGKRLIWLVLPLALFFLSFAPYVLREAHTLVSRDGFYPTLERIEVAVRNPPGSPERRFLRESFPASRAIYQMVFAYRPARGRAVFWDDFAPGFVHRMGAHFYCFIVALLATGWVVRKLPLVPLLGTYCLALTFFSCGHWMYYWAIPLLFTACYPNRWSVAYSALGFAYFLAYHWFGLKPSGIDSFWPDALLVALALSAWKAWRGTRPHA